MSHPNEALITRFYTAFQNGDSEAMAACYHPDIEFKDPVFELKGVHAGNMWRMLVGRGGGGLEITFRDVKANNLTGRAHWEARYPFSKSGRTVHNKIDAEFAFRDGLIVDHTDTFNFWKWTRMALGPMGFLMGWTSMVQNKVRSQAMGQLRKFEEAQEG
jgi:ketosteroid isomerase-like protein